MQVGVLALQGGFELHVRALRALGVEPTYVRRPEQLDALTHLIVPGGESTTLHRLMSLFGLVAPIVERHRAGKLALFGTCAGAILLGRDDGTRPPRLELLDAFVTRNAYGRQLDSFTKRLDVDGAPMDCVFIRAPKLTRIGEGVHVLARDGDDPILVEAPGVLAATFHPELSGETRVHARFLALGPRRDSPRRRAGSASGAP